MFRRLRLSLGLRDFGNTADEKDIRYRVYANTPFIAAAHAKRVFGPKVRQLPGGVETEMQEGLTCWTGEPGSGKTYAMVEVALAYHKLGWDVVTNGLDLTFESASYQDFGSLCALIDSSRRNRTVVLLDEAPMWANSRRWQEFPSAFFSRLQQVRKYGFLMHYSAINFNKVDNNLRDQTYWVWECTRGIFTGRFIRKLRVPEELAVPGERPRLKRKVRARQYVYDSYGTHTFLTTPQGRDRVDYLPGLEASAICQSCGAVWTATSKGMRIERGHQGCYDCV